MKTLPGWCGEISSILIVPSSGMAFGVTSVQFLAVVPGQVNEPIISARPELTLGMGRFLESKNRVVDLGRPCLVSCVEWEFRVAPVSPLRFLSNRD